jgi:hypothetical protein
MSDALAVTPLLFIHLQVTASKIVFLIIFLQWSMMCKPSEKRWGRSPSA